MTNIKDILNKNNHFEIIKKIGKLGDEMKISSYLVGGYVRDSLLGRKLLDIDVLVISGGVCYTPGHIVVMPEVWKAGETRER